METIHLQNKSCSVQAKPTETHSTCKLWGGICIFLSKTSLWLIYRWSPWTPKLVSSFWGKTERTPKTTLHDSCSKVAVSQAEEHKERSSGWKWQHCPVKMERKELVKLIWCFMTASFHVENELQQHALKIDFIPHLLRSFFYRTWGVALKCWSTLRVLKT